MRRSRMVFRQPQKPVQSRANAFSAAQRLRSGQLVEEEINGGDLAAPGDDEIRSGSSLQTLGQQYFERNCFFLSRVNLRFTPAIEVGRAPQTPAAHSRGSGPTVRQR
jgi:hypothetical protein